MILWYWSCIILASTHISILGTFLDSSIQSSLDLTLSRFLSVAVYRDLCSDLVVWWCALDQLYDLLSCDLQYATCLHSSPHLLY